MALNNLARKDLDAQIRKLSENNNFYRNLAIAHSKIFNRNLNKDEL
jgi:hypothetical protein